MAGPLPSSPALTKERAAGPATAPIVDMAAPGKARAERPGEAAGGGYRVQLHALSSDAAVRREWPRLQKTHGDLLGGLSLKVVRTGSGPRQKSFYRMQIGTLASVAAAKKLCDRLKRRKLDCVIVRP
ncbi:MAG: SPOR domain-containing protein [Proteobacteria bacterium]|nr:SPOR domain-containing protein [Pseudomonadota bacterium]